MEMGCECLEVIGSRGSGTRDWRVGRMEPDFRCPPLLPFLIDLAFPSPPTRISRAPPAAAEINKNHDGYNICSIYERRCRPKCAAWLVQWPART